MYKAQLREATLLSRQRAHANMGLVAEDLRRTVGSRHARDYVGQVAAMSAPADYRDYVGAAPVTP